LCEKIKKLAHILDIKCEYSLPQCPGCRKRCLFDMECMENGESTHVRCGCGILFCFLCNRLLYNNENQYWQEIQFGINVANCSRNGPFPAAHNEGWDKDVSYNPLFAENFKRCPKTFKELSTCNGFNTQDSTEARYRVIILKSLSI